MATPTNTRASADQVTRLPHDQQVSATIRPNVFELLDATADFGAWLIEHDAQRRVAVQKAQAGPK